MPFKMTKTPLLTKVLNSPRKLYFYCFVLRSFYNNRIEFILTELN